ncbi:MAG: hypothetical protein ACR2GX_08575 [Candidatus Dormibacteria bacterium]
MTNENPPPPPQPEFSPPPPAAAEPPGVVAQPVAATTPVVATETRSTAVALEPQGPHPVLMLLIGFIIGALIGLGIAYLVFHSSTSSPGSLTPTPTAVLLHLTATLHNF